QCAVALVDWTRPSGEDAPAKPVDRHITEPAFVNLNEDQRLAVPMRRHATELTRTPTVAVAVHELGPLHRPFGQRHEHLPMQQSLGYSNSRSSQMQQLSFAMSRVNAIATSLMLSDSLGHIGSHC